MARLSTWFRFLRKHRGFYLLLLLAIVLRTDFILESGLSNDELSAWYRTRFSSWNDFWFYGIQWGDMHPMLYQTVLWIWVRIFGDGDVSIRLLPFLFFLANFSLIYRIATRHFSRLTGLIACGLFACSSYFVIQTGFSRPYASGTFGVLFFIEGLLPLFNDYSKWKRRHVIVMLIGLLVAMLSHYFAFLTVGVAGVLALAFVPKRNRMGVFLSGGLAMLVFAMHLSITLYQLNRGGLQWLGLPSDTWLFEVWTMIINHHEIAALSVGTVILLLGLGFSSWNSKRLYLLFTFLGVLIFAYILSYKLTPILRESVFQFMFPFLIFGVLGSLEKLNYPSVSKVIVVCAAGFLGAWTILEFPPGQPIHFASFKEIGDERNVLTDEFPAENRTDIFNTNNPAYLLRYTPADITADIGEYEDGEKKIAIKALVEKAQTEYFYYAHTNNFHLPDYLDEIQKKYPFLVRHKEYMDAAYYLFGKSVFDGKRCSKEILKIRSRPQRSDEEFFGRWQIQVSNLQQIEKENSYFHIATQQLNSANGPVRLVVVLEDENGMKRSAADLPVYYRSEDLLANNQSTHVVFEITEQMLPTDNFVFYLWNPNKVKAEIGPISLNQVDLPESK